MSTLTIRNLDDGVKRRLRAQAAEHGRSMEEEARVALQRHVGVAPGESLYDMFQRTLGPVAEFGVDLEPFPRPLGTRRKPPEVFDE